MRRSHGRYYYEKQMDTPTNFFRKYLQALVIVVIAVIILLTIVMCPVVFKNNFRAIENKFRENLGELKEKLKWLKYLKYLDLSHNPINDPDTIEEFKRKLGGNLLI